MNQAEKAQAFAALHIPGKPVILYNIWDAGSARTVAKAGAPAIATGSWSVAAAQGYSDGQAIPFDLLLTVVERISATVDLPLTVDFEGGYAVEPNGLRENVSRLMGAGAIGINFEDQIVGGEGLHAIDVQSERIAAIRAAADAAGLPFFINARTDLFLKERDADRHKSLVQDAVERASAYADAGASGFFVPGLTDPDLVGKICADVPLPVNVMMAPKAPSIGVLSDCGVARVSFGGWPYMDATAALTERFNERTGAGPQ